MNEQLLQITSWVEMGNEIYFKAYNFPGLYVYNKSNNKLYNIEEPENPDGWNRCSYDAVGLWNEYIVFMPYVSHYFEIFNVLSKEIVYIRKPNDIWYKSGKVYKDKIFMFALGESLSNALVLDMVSMNISFLKLHDEMYEDCKLNIYSEMCMDEDKLYIPIRGESSFLILNLETLKADKIIIPDEKNEIGLIYKVDNSLFFAGAMDYIIKWDGKRDFIKIQIPMCVKPNMNWEMLFSGATVVGNYLYFAPLRYDRLIRINLANECVEEVPGMIDRGCAFGIRKYDDEHISIDFSYGLERMRSSVLLDVNNVIKQEEMFVINEDIDLTVYGKEYNSYSLRQFLQRMI